MWKNMFENERLKFNCIYVLCLVRIAFKSVSWKTRNPESGIRNPEPGIRNLESGIRNPES